MSQQKNHSDNHNSGSPTRKHSTDEPESLWARYPDYRVDLDPCPMTARAWYGDELLAESDRCLIVRETKHADCLYFPEQDVRWELFTATDHHTRCPFKGEADYWSLTAVDPVEQNLVWAYRQPFEEVAGLKGYVCFYQDRVRLVLEERWRGGDAGQKLERRFPLWGDQRDLLKLIDVQPRDDGAYTAPAYWDEEPVDVSGRPIARNVVEGGQLLSQAIVAAAKAVPQQRVTSAFMTFTRPAVFHQSTELDVQVLRSGRSFSTVQSHTQQDGKLRAAALLLLDAGGGEAIRGVCDMPEVPGPLECPHLDMSIAGREFRVVDGAYDMDPDRVGPPEIMVWCRYRDAPDAPYLHSALLAQATTHWTIAAAMRPHRGVSEAQAHRTLSTAPVSVSIAFHDEVDVTDWLLYANRAVYAGRGQAQGEGHVFTQDGRLVATYTVQTMIRPFAREAQDKGIDPKTAM